MQELCVRSFVPIPFQPRPSSLPSFRREEKEAFAYDHSHFHLHNAKCSFTFNSIVIRKRGGGNRDRRRRKGKEEAKRLTALFCHPTQTHHTPNQTNTLLSSHFSLILKLSSFGIKQRHPSFICWTEEGRKEEEPPPPPSQFFYPILYSSFFHYLPSCFFTQLFKEGRREGETPSKFYAPHPVWCEVVSGEF